jgi:hypothetical protein
MTLFEIKLDTFDEQKYDLDLKHCELHIIKQHDSLKISVSLDTSGLLLDSVALVSDYRSDAAKFVRNDFKPLFCKQLDDVSCVEFSFEPQHAGTFRFFVVNAQASGDVAARRRSDVFAIVVQPMATIVVDGEERVLQVEDLVMQTVLSKCLGAVERWPAQLALLPQHGFNAVHFTPLAALGRSNSAYSLADQSTFDARFAFRQDQRAAEQQLDTLLRHLESQSGVVAFVDVVLNHTADNSSWLSSHPEAVYNTDNSPHLVCHVVFA